MRVVVLELDSAKRRAPLVPVDPKEWPPDRSHVETAAQVTGLGAATGTHHHRTPTMSGGCPVSFGQAKLYVKHVVRLATCRTAGFLIGRCPATDGALFTFGPAANG
jgi:hypothetical protein